MLLSCKSVGKTGELESFEHPLFQSWIMFVAMTCALPVHFAYQWYQERKMSEERASLTQSINAPARLPKASMPTWTYFILAVPSCFDLIATVLCMFGLMYISVSVYQLLRGACIVFVALMKHYYLKDRLKIHQWLGVGLLALAISLVGMTSVFGASEGPDGAARGGGIRPRATRVVMCAHGRAHLLRPSSLARSPPGTRAPASRPPPSRDLASRSRSQEPGRRDPADLVRRVRAVPAVRL
jgi:multidrug transporter EmrE-like cation transporter